MVLVRIAEVLVGFFVLLWMYWSPTMIAFGRRARPVAAIATLNTLAGWTIIGWLIAFVWSLAAPAETGTSPALAVERQPVTTRWTAIFGAFAARLSLARF